MGIIYRSLRLEIGESAEGCEEFLPRMKRMDTDGGCRFVILGSCNGRRVGHSRFLTHYYRERPFRTLTEITVAERGVVIEKFLKLEDVKREGRCGKALRVPRALKGRMIADFQ